MLTPRQSEIAALVAKGMSNKAIAREVGISAETVDRHIRDAAERIPYAGRPRHRCTIWFLSLSVESEEAA